MRVEGLEIEIGENVHFMRKRRIRGVCAQRAPNRFLEMFQNLIDDKQGFSGFISKDRDIPFFPNVPDDKAWHQNPGLVDNLIV